MITQVPFSTHLQQDRAVCKKKNDGSNRFTKDACVKLRGHILLAGMKKPLVHMKELQLHPSLKTEGMSTGNKLLVSQHGICTKRFAR